MDNQDTYSVSIEFCLGRWTFVEFYAWKNILTHWITVILSEKLLGESEVCAIYLTAQNKNHNYEYVVYFEIIKKYLSCSYFIFEELFCLDKQKHNTVCLRSSDSFYIVTYYINWVTTFWTDGKFVFFKSDSLFNFVQCT